MLEVCGFSPLLERALRIAAVAHRLQTRKGTDLPYLTHPVQTVVILLRHGLSDEKILATAVLHDVLEDTTVSLSDLQGDFPEEVWRGVASLTERKLDEAGEPRPWSVRKQEHREQVLRAEWWVRGIAIADKIHNLGTMWYDLQTDLRLWERFNASPQESLENARALISASEQGDERLRSLAEEGRQWVGRLESALG